MLHTVDKAVSSSDGQGFANPADQNDAALPLRRTYPLKTPVLDKSEPDSVPSA